MKKTDLNQKIVALNGIEIARTQEAINYEVLDLIRLSLRICDPHALSSRKSTFKRTTEKNYPSKNQAA